MLFGPFRRHAAAARHLLKLSYDDPQARRVERSLPRSSYREYASPVQTGERLNTPSALQEKEIVVESGGRRLLYVHALGVRGREFFRSLWTDMVNSEPGDTACEAMTNPAVHAQQFGRIGVCIKTMTLRK